MFNDEECGNLKVVVESLLEQLTEKNKSDFLKVYMPPLCDKCCMSNKHWTSTKIVKLD